jgi:phosphoglycerate dehydrogenase-like enzyme
MESQKPASIDVLVTIPFQEHQIAQLREISPRLRIQVLPVRKPEEIPAEVWLRSEVLYTDRVLPMPDQVPNLRWLQFHYAGIDFALDMPILKKPELLVTNLSGAATPQMAEFALTMILALGHRVLDLQNSQSKSDWPRDRWERFRPLELRGSTVGIVGYGSIGREIARLVRCFGATVLATKKDAMRPEDTGYTIAGLGDPGGDLFHRLYPAQALRSMLKECDFVVVTVPLTPETRGLIGAAELAAMKPGAFLIHIARGGIVDQAALIAALQERKIAGAALDVFQEEPLPSNSPLWKMNNVMISPHIAGISMHYDERALQLFIENLKRYLAGAELLNRFNPERGY